MISFHLLTDILHFVKSAWLSFGPHRVSKHLKDWQIKKCFAAERNIEGIETFIDFYKAFDSLEWEF